MAEQLDSTAAEGPQVLYMNGAVSEGIPLDKHSISSQKAAYSAFEIRIDKTNPNRAELVPVPGNDQMLLPNYNAILKPAFAMGQPQPGDQYIHVGKPAELERVGDTWKMVNRGELSTSPTPQVRQAPQVQQTAAAPTPQQEQPQQAGPTPALNYTQYAPTPETGVIENRKIVGQASPQFNIGITDDGKFGINPQVSQERLIGDGMSKLKKYFDFEAPTQYPIARVNVDAPGQMEKTADGWQVATKGSLVVTDTQGNVFRTTPRQDQPQQAASQSAAQASQEQPTPVQAAQAPAAAPAPAQQAPSEAKPAASLGLDANPTPAPSATPAVTPAAAEQAKPGVGELQIRWKQQGDGVAPLTEMRAYLAELKEAGVAVGAMKFGPGADGKLTSSFGVSYDPNAPDLTKLEGTIQGLKKVGGGLDVVEAPEQAVARRRGLGHEGQDKALDLAFPVKEAFGVRQWDSLSAQLSSAPKQALTGPEQAQQAAGIERVNQIAKSQGKTTEHVIQEGKNLLEIDTSGNPVSAFLKNFYEHLNGAAKTRQNLEVDYEKTRQDLQARLTAKAGNALPDVSQGETVAKTPAVAAAVVGTAATSAASSPEQPAPKVDVPAVPKAEPLFKESELPKDKLALFGLSVAKLKESGQLEKLLAGEKTDLLAMQGGAQRDKPLVPFDGKLMLHREANGSVTLNVELPKQKLIIPNEIGGQPFTPEQRHKLETEGSAGLMRGLRDAAGNPYNGYVGVDKTMNTIVILPEKNVTIKDEIAGVKLSPEQSKDLREGHLVHLPNMRRPDGGQSFDGTVQIHAAKAGVEVRPEPYEQQQKKQPELTQAQPVATERSEKPGQKPAAETVQVQRQEVTPKPIEKVEEPTQQRSRGPRR